MVNDCEMTLARDGGKGYNVVATLPGSVPGAGRIVIGAHHDAYFHAGLDDTGGVTCGMLMAKAIKLSGYRPARDITFLFTTGEEYGATDSYYDWLIGAWHAITQRHPGWAGSTPLMLNLESMAMNGARMETRATPEVMHLIEAAAAAHPERLPWGYSIKNVNCWNDQWTFTAAGVPSMYFRARTGEYGFKWYHTNFDTIDLMDYKYLAVINKLMFGIAQEVRQGRAALRPDGARRRPGRQRGRGRAQGRRRQRAKVDQAGGRRSLASRAARPRSRRAAAHIPATARVHGQRARSCRSRSASTRRSRRSTCGTPPSYPHVQVQWDLEQHQRGHRGAGRGSRRRRRRLDSLKGVGITAPYASRLQPRELPDAARHPPARAGAGGLFWGAQGHLSPYLDVVPTMQKVDDGNYAAASASLSVMRTSEVNQLNDRLDAMSRALEGVNAVPAVDPVVRNERRQ